MWKQLMNTYISKDKIVLIVRRLLIKRVGVGWHLANQMGIVSYLIVCFFSGL